MLELTIQNEQDLPDVPPESLLQHWVVKALQQDYPQLEQVIRIVDAEEIQALNKRFRGNDKATNILSFPAEQHDFLDYECLGDLVVCAPVVALEAHQQKKIINDHWAHLIVHGMLHLQGFDHIEDSEAQKMEALEIAILAQMNISNPYLG